MAEKLFAVVLGGYAPRCNTELHDVVFVVGESIQETFPSLLGKWFGTPESCHVDAWTELSIVDGYRIRLEPHPQEGGRKLFFINLGAYDPRHFGELHACTFLVSEDRRDVRERAHDARELGEDTDLEDPRGGVFCCPARRRGSVKWVTNRGCGALQAAELQHSSRDRAGPPVSPGSHRADSRAPRS